MTGDPKSGSDRSARIHGLANGYVADASIISVAPRANTNLRAAMVAERIAGLHVEDLASRRVE
ncbi:MAG: GMC oxidoreductase [Betaproteobacteria bacterium]